MNILVIILLSYVFYYLFEGIYICSICNDIADKGFKLNSDKIKNPFYLDNYWALKYIPILNYLVSVFNVYKYSIKRMVVLNNIMLKGLLTKMTEEELKLYAKDPSALNAFIIISKSLRNEEQSNSNKEEICIVQEEFKIDEENVILYQMNVKALDGDFKIVSSKGELSKLSEEEQLSIVTEYQEEIWKSIEEYVETIYSGNRERFESDIINNKIDNEELKNYMKLEETREKILRRINKESV